MATMGPKDKARKEAIEKKYLGRRVLVLTHIEKPGKATVVGVKAWFWGTTLFSLCVDALRQANVIKTSHTLHTGDAP